jgi:hypothetical protein
MSTSPPPKARLTSGALADDLIWGVAGEDGIAAEIGRKPSEVYALIASGKLGHAVTKLGHRTIIASRRKLQRVLTGED